MTETNHIVYFRLSRDVNNCQVYKDARNSVKNTLKTRSYYRKENAADVLTNQELLFHVTIVLRARIFGSLVSVLNSCSGDGTFVT